jgi:hypothetical protein
MKTKRRQEGHLLIDHRGSPGVSEALTHAAGLPGSAGKGVFESATVRCSHCHATVILNPDRSRPRGWCASCDGYVCDNPACNTGTCLPQNKVLDIIEELLHSDPVRAAAFQAEWLRARTGS